eukprot:4167892-Pyramimonas_sp.AAC.1
MACASLSFGGSSLDNLAPWAASAADFPTCKMVAFDKYSAPRDTKLEPGPRAPVVFDQWKRQAQNMT